MGISDSISGAMDKAKDAVKGHGDDIDKGVDAAGDKVDDATKGKYANKTDKGQQMAKDQIKKTNK